MSSNDESDEEFQSADEDIDFEPHSEQKSQNKSEDSDELTQLAKNENHQKSDKPFPDLDQQMNQMSVENQEMEAIVSTEEKVESLKWSQTLTQTRSQTPVCDLIKHKDYKREEQTSDETNAEKCEKKTLIKGRKILRKADRLREQTKTEEPENNEIKSIVSVEDKEKSKIISKPEKEVKTPELNQSKENIFGSAQEDNQIDDNTEEEVISNEPIIQKSEDNKTKDTKTLIKGRKLLRKVDILREETKTEESEISEQKKSEVLNKLSTLSERDDTTSKWNNWFTDIKSAAMTATSTTASHVSQASNKWSLNPKSLLTSAVSITTNVGSGISSVVENVSSAVDSAIGAPPPEQMAALVNKDIRADNTSETVEKDINEIPNKSSLGFGLFDYTLNTLESIGKKTMEVIVDDKHKRDLKTDKKD